MVMNSERFEKSKIQSYNTIRLMWEIQPIFVNMQFIIIDS